VLVARSAVPDPCRLSLGPGEALAASLGDRALVVERSNVRRLVREGRASLARDGTARRLAAADERGYPLDDDRRILALLTARLAPQ
jgi:hypothetical protein